LNTSFEPECLYCAAGECLDEAIVIGYATIRANPLASPTGTALRHTFSLPLCAHHAYLLRMDNTLVEFDNGTLNRDHV
jgi:hypothetical protein